jgi:hypothetical protein
MTFKSKKPPEVASLPQQQSAPELMDVIDELSGYQTITVTGPDGKKRRHTQRLPLTPQEQQTLDQAEKLINQAVNNIETLYRYDPSTVVDYQPFIQEFSKINNERMGDLAKIGNFEDIAEKVEKFRTISHDLTMREFDNNQRMSEENLARRGLQRSTEASESRAAMARERALLGQQVDVNSENYGEDLQNRRLQREASIYGIRDQGRQGRLQEAEMLYGLERQKADDIERTRQNAINENVNMMNVGQSLKGADNEKARLALAGNQNAVSMLTAQAQNQNQRFSNDINRIQGQYGMDMQRFKETPATFGQKLTDLGLAAAGTYAGAGIAGAIPSIGASMGASAGAQAPAFGQSLGRKKALNQIQSLGRA